MSTEGSLFRAWWLGAALALVGIVLVSESFAAVSVYYFHRTVRCSDCLLIEQMSADLLQETFPRELADGRLVWRPTNLDLPENIHYVFDYDLDANELVVARGETSRRDYHKLPEVWALAYQPEQFRPVLIKLIREQLTQPD